MVDAAFSIPPHLPHTVIGPVTIVYGHQNGKYPDGNLVLVQGAHTRVAFDLPQVSRQLGDVLASMDMVILGHVHEDHVVGLRSVPHVPLWVHEGDTAAVRSWAGLAAHYGYPDAVWQSLRERIATDFEFAPRPDAQAYTDGMRWDLGGGVSVQAVHLPGHTRGHCALVVEPVGVAFIGDIDLSSFGPYYGDATSNLAQFRDTLHRVRDLPAQHWITSHHKGLVSDRAEFQSMLDAFASRIQRRTDQLIAMLAAGPQTLDELAQSGVMYPPGHDQLWVNAAERRTIEQHLTALVAAGEVVPMSGGHSTEIRYALATG